MNVFLEQKSFVYLVEAENGLIKIGCSIVPQSRADTIRSLSPIRTRLIAVIAGTRADEPALHERFEEYRDYNEWFRCEGRLKEFVRAVRGCGIERVIDWSEIAWIETLSKRQNAAIKRSAALKAIWATPGYREKRLEENRRWRERRPQEGVAQ